MGRGASALDRTTAALVASRGAPTASALSISRTDARRLAIVAQHLGGPPPRPTRAAAMKIIRDIGYLQAKRKELFESPSLILPVSDLALHLTPVQRPHTVAGLRRGPSSMDLWR